MSDEAVQSLGGEPTPVLPHLAGEFLLWLWWISEKSGGRLDGGVRVGPFDAWVDSRLSFRAPGEGKAAAVLTGENPAAALEARAALLGGKVVQDVRIGIRHEEKEFFATIKAPGLDLGGVKLPQVVKGTGEEALYDRMALYEELHGILVALFEAFAVERSGAAWTERVVPAIETWILQRETAEE